MRASVAVVLVAMVPFGAARGDGTQPSEASVSDAERIEFGLIEGRLRAEHPPARTVYLEDAKRLLLDPHGFAVSGEAVPVLRFDAQRGLELHVSREQSEGTLQLWNDGTVLHAFYVLHARGKRLDGDQEIAADKFFRKLPGIGDDGYVDAERPAPPPPPPPKPYSRLRECDEMGVPARSAENSKVTEKYDKFDKVEKVDSGLLRMPGGLYFNVRFDKPTPHATLGDVTVSISICGDPIRMVDTGDLLHVIDGAYEHRWALYTSTECALASLDLSDAIGLAKRHHVDARLGHVDVSLEEAEIALLRDALSRLRPAVPAKKP